MTRFIPALMLAALLTVAACAGIQTRDQKIDTACASATAALRVVAIGVQNGKVTPEQQALAVQAGDAIVPVCAAPVRPSLDAIKQAAFDRAITQIILIAERAR